MPPSFSTLPNRPDLSDRVVFITGATGGLGRALALACAQSGATVVLHARVVRKLEALYDEILASGGPEPIIVPLDFTVATSADFSNVASALHAATGRLDALIHTAVALGSLGPLEHQTMELWDSTLRVDLLAPFALTRALLPLMRAANDASVTFTLDTRGQAPKAYWGAYAVAKAGLGALVTIMADEYESAPQVRINGVVPGPMRSPLRAQTHPGDDITRLPAPESHVPLYLHLVAGQLKSESGRIVDAGGWLRAASAGRDPPETS